MFVFVTHLCLLHICVYALFVYGCWQAVEGLVVLPEEDLSSSEGEGGRREEELGGRTQHRVASELMVATAGDKGESKSW